MQYFKHMTVMRNDIKIKRLINKYGLEGYGLYNLIIESIAENITTEHPIPELKETCEDIALFYNGNTAKINEIMAFMLNQGLFEIDEITGRVLCQKIYKFLEQSQTRSPEIRRLISNYKNVTDCLRLSQTNMKEQEQEQEQEQKKNRKHKLTIPSLNEILSYISEQSLSVDGTFFLKYYTESNWIDSNGKKVINWKLKLLTWDKQNKNRRQKEIDKRTGIDYPEL